MEDLLVKAFEDIDVNRFDIEEKVKEIPYSSENLRKIFDNKVQRAILINQLNNECMKQSEKHFAAHLIKEINKKDIEKNLENFYSKVAKLCVILDIKYLKMLSNEEVKSTFINISNIDLHLNESDILIEDLDISINEGEKVIVFGKNGSGKSTLLNMISGKIPIYIKENSEMVLLGHNALIESNWAKIKKDILFLSRTKSIWKSTVYEDLLFACNGNVNKVNEFNDFLDLSKYKSYQWSQLSDGFKSRYIIAYALIKAPKLLILDEVFGVLDIGSLTYAITVIKKYSFNMTIIFTSQSLYDLEDLADKVIFIENKKNFCDSRESFPTSKKNLLKLKFEEKTFLDKIFYTEILNKEIFVTTEDNILFFIETIIDKKFIIQKLLRENKKLNFIQDLTNSLEYITFKKDI